MKGKGIIILFKVYKTHTIHERDDAYASERIGIKVLNGLFIHFYFFDVGG